MRRYYIQKRYVHDTQWQRIYAIKGFFIKSHAEKACAALNEPDGVVDTEIVEYRIWDDKEKVAL